MPLRDHFHPPIFKHHAWEGFHASWPTTIVRSLFDLLPEGYLAEPRAHLGAYYEVDVASFEGNGTSGSNGSGRGGGVATGTATRATVASPWAPPAPTETLDADQTEPSEYEVLVYDANRARRLVAAVEIVSPANKDRADHRRAFVAKCAALLHSDVCVSIVDLVTLRSGNLYAELLDELGVAPRPPGALPALYAVTCRRQVADHRVTFDVWSHALELGRPLPTLPMWLADDYAVPLELEVTYEETCRFLHIT